MLEISNDEIIRNLEQDNPWWLGRGFPDGAVPKRRRQYFEDFKDLATNFDVHRSVILMGPRRVGKTVMLRQLVQQCLADGFQAQDIFFASLDTPLYHGLSLDRLLDMFESRNGRDDESQRLVIFDEVQYLANWEVHLKVLTDRRPNIRFVASGSAAAALRLKSQESGAGRFTDFILPPLTFAEFLHFRGVEDRLIRRNEDDYETDDIDALNEEFINYLNFGGYPEAVMTPQVRDDLGRFLGRDIIDKVLLRDLPSLYGIQNIQELNRLFMTIAYYSGMEVSMDSLASNSGVSKTTIQRYLEYLEAAFLIVRVTKINDSGKTFQRMRNFKVYLTNPSMRAALFSPLSDGDEAMGHMAETGIFSQWFHGANLTQLHYARWKSGRKDREVDIVYVDRSTLGPRWAVEVKWSDRYFDNPAELTGLIEFSEKNLDLEDRRSPVAATTKTKAGITVSGRVAIRQRPCSIYCYTVGKNLSRHRYSQNSVQE